MISPTTLPSHLFLLYFKQMALLSWNFRSNLCYQHYFGLYWAYSSYFSAFWLFQSQKLKFFIMTLSMPSLALIFGRLTIRLESLLFSKNYVLSSWLVKLFRLCLSTSTYPSCWMIAHVQPVPTKGDRSNPLSYRPITLISCFLKVFEYALNKKISRSL